MVDFLIGLFLVLLLLVELFFALIVLQNADYLFGQSYKILFWKVPPSTFFWVYYLAVAVGILAVLSLYFIKKHYLRRIEQFKSKLYDFLEGKASLEESQLKEEIRKLREDIMKTLERGGKKKDEG